MKNKYVTQQKMTTTEIQAPDLGQAHKECVGLNMFVPANISKYC